MKTNPPYELTFIIESNHCEWARNMKRLLQETCKKVSGCFGTTLYAQADCRISSYLQTMANKAVNPLIAIQMALAGENLFIGAE